MARMLVQIADKINRESVALDAQCYKRGDVIWIEDDDFVWGSAEGVGPTVLVRVLGVGKGLLLNFLDREPGDLLANPLLQRRAAKFDLDQYIADGSPALITLAQALGYKKSRLPRVA